MSGIDGNWPDEEWRHDVANADPEPPEDYDPADHETPSRRRRQRDYRAIWGRATPPQEDDQ